MTEFEQGDKVKLVDKRADVLSFGTGVRSTGVVFGRDGERAPVMYGKIFKVSAYTDADMFSLDSSPVPLVKKSFINGSERVNSLFVLVEKAEK